MARMARVVVPDYPHHVMQRGNRRQKTFFCDDDYQYYIELIAEYSKQSETDVWAYCLMPNHVHIAMVPKEEDGCVQHLGKRIDVIRGISIFARVGGEQTT